MALLAYLLASQGDFQKLLEIELLLSESVLLIIEVVSFAVQLYAYSYASSSIKKNGNSEVYQLLTPVTKNLYTVAVVGILLLDLIRRPFNQMFGS